MTNRLLILDKDGTLTTSKSGDRFPQHPQDQQLLPNVAETLDRYAADGWQMAIAFNQGGCNPFAIKVLDVKPGMIWVDQDSPVKLSSVFQHGTGVVELSGWTEIDGQQVYLGSRFFDADTLIQCCYKTLEDAIEEMRYCMKLTPQVDVGLFCPDQGESLYHSARSGEIVWWPHRLPLGDIDEIDNFRKPCPGMLQFAQYYFECGAYAFAAEKYGRNVKFHSVLFVGDRPEDEAAAQAAEIPFQWAKDFFGWGGSDE